MFRRTTVDLPRELVTALKRQAVEEGISFKAIYNRALAREFGRVARPFFKGHGRYPAREAETNPREILIIMLTTLEISDHILKKARHRALTEGVPRACSLSLFGA